MAKKAFRVFSIAIGACGVILYLFWLWTQWMVALQGDFASRHYLLKVWFVFEAVFLAGLPPLMLALYFLIWEKSTEANIRGLAYVAIFIPVHDLVAATTAHSRAMVYIPAQVLELAAAITLIAIWKGRKTRNQATISR